MPGHSQSLLNLHNIIPNQITAKLKPFQMKRKKIGKWGSFLPFRNVIDKNWQETQSMFVLVLR